MENKQHKISITSGDKHVEMKTDFAIVIMKTEQGFTFSKLGSDNIVDDTFNTIIATEAIQSGVNGLLEQPHIKRILKEKFAQKITKEIRSNIVKKDISFEALKDITEEPFAEFNS